MEQPGFVGYFHETTPIDEIEALPIASRPARRRGKESLQDLRAIPWVFAWTQARYILPGWYGVGTGLRKAIDKYGEAAFGDLFREWFFMRALVADVEMVLAKSDLGIARLYSELAGDLHDEFFPKITGEFERTRDTILEFSEHESLLEGDFTLQRAIALRNPYVDPISLMQVELLRRWRSVDRNDDELFDALLATVNGIAQGLQNTG